MSNINRWTSNSEIFSADEEILTELTAEEGADISGGLTYYIGNKTDIGVNYSINGASQYLPPGEEYVYYYGDQPVVEYDYKIGAGYYLTQDYPNPGRNNFDRSGNSLFLTTGGSSANANLTANDSLVGE
jgi:hypothetical protein